MRLSPAQRDDFERDGFLIFPNLFSGEEVRLLREETDRLATIDADYVKRERRGGLRTVFRVHEDDGPTRSAEFRALSRTPRLVGPAMQLIGDDQLYIFHTKINFKPALEGTIWSWHQDYGTWQRDGVPTPNMVTYLVMLDDAEEIGGALYFVPGSHRLGTLPHVEDPAVGALNQYSVQRDVLLQALEASKPVPVTGAAGSVAVFHSNLIHGSGHNMSPRDRRQLYIVYNPVANRSRPVAAPRGDQPRADRARLRLGDPRHHASTGATACIRCGLLSARRPGNATSNGAACARGCACSSPAAESDRRSQLPATTRVRGCTYATSTRRSWDRRARCRRKSAARSPT